MGFITKSVDDLEWVCEKTIGRSLEPNPYLYGEWDRKKYEEAKKKPLRFGYLIEDHEMKCAPSIRNSLLESCEKLRAAGHEVVQF